MYVIYKHTNKINGKVYIGQTCQDPPRLRWGKDGTGYLTADTRFARAIKKYSWDNFWHEIIETDLTCDEANKRETFWIQFYNSAENGYNSTYGGDNQVWSEEAKQQARERMQGTGNSFFGRHHSSDTKEVLRQVFGKSVICLETGREWESANQAGEFLGIDGANIRSACRIGISAKVGKDWFHFYYKDEPQPEFKPVQVKKVYCLETNEVFENLTKAGESINKTSKLIGMCCRGKIQTAGGYHWAYLKDYYNMSNNERKQLLNLNAIGKGRKKKIQCIETNQIYESISAASRAMQVDFASMQRACQDPINRASCGYHWKCIED